MNRNNAKAEKVRIWRERVEAQVASGKSVRLFCEEHQLKIFTFCYWQRKFRGSSRKNPNTVFLSNLPRRERRFVPVSRVCGVAGSIHAAFKSPIIHLPNGVRVELGEGLESLRVNQLIRSLCGVNSHAKS